jgi:hypothetical protein
MKQVDIGGPPAAKHVDRDLIVRVRKICELLFGYSNVGKLGDARFVNFYFSAVECDDPISLTDSADPSLGSPLKYALTIIVSLDAFSRSVATSDSSIFILNSGTKIESRSEGLCSDRSMLSSGV